jgi:hypothetical protein
VSVNLIRPAVRDLSFHLYTRPLHPELFETLALRRVRKDDFTLTVRIIPAGHVLTWVTPSSHLTEVTTSTQLPLPSTGRLIHHRFHGEHAGEAHPTRDCTYQMNSQVEKLTPELFQSVHQDILNDGLRRGLLHHLNPNHRWALSPLGFITVEAIKRNSLVINTFHTFPEEYTIIKTQSLIERC